jgi:hypothetical protein
MVEREGCQPDVLAAIDRRDAEIAALRGLLGRVCEGLPPVVIDKVGEFRGVGVYLTERKECSEQRGPCGMRGHHDDCDCGGMGGDR